LIFILDLGKKYKLKIDIKKIDNDNFEVKVLSRTTTSHKVNLDDNIYKKMTNKKISKLKLIELSFEFLLKREPNTSILSAFELSIINNYFPEFENEITIKIKE
tara:strand:- start:57 stop:365 length:309 start_codon:yes stop_codon:yes gene_type:complete